MFQWFIKSLVILVKAFFRLNSNNRPKSLSKNISQKNELQEVTLQSNVDTLVDDFEVNKLPLSVTTQLNEKFIELLVEKESQDTSNVEETPAFPTSEQEPPQAVPRESESLTSVQETTEEPNKPRKPYKKKAPAEETPSPPRRRPTTDTTSRRKRSVFLGGFRQTRNRTSLTNSRRLKDTGSNEAEQISDAKESFYIQSPFIEISLEEVTASLILPEQLVMADTEEQPAQVFYHVELNGDSQEISAAARPSNGSNALVERREIRLENAPKTLSITYPELLDERRFDYTQTDSSFYLFRAIGNDQGRMFWLFDKAGHPNPLPKRCFWLLLHEGYELEQPSPILIDERWIWNNYKPYLIDLAQSNVLQIRNRTSERSITLGAEKSFQIESEELVEDDFRLESPLFCGRRISIKAPYTNEEGWTVWISSKEQPAQLLRTDWTGEAPIILECPDHLPVPFGEFQIDICSTGSRIAEETLFFRWFPSIVIAIEHKRNLVFPDAQKGHSAAEIRIQLQEPDQWEISNDKNYPVRLTDSNCTFYLPPETDCVRMTIRQRNIAEPAISIKLTVPRVKWRTSDTLAWHSGSSTMEREQLTTGAQVNLTVRTNDIFKEYDLTAVLQTGNQQLQTERMSKHGFDYVIALNRFFDTIAANSHELCICVEVRDDDDKRLLGTIQTAVFAQETIGKQIESQTHPAKKTKSKQAYHAKVKCAGNTNKRRPGKGFSKKEIETAGLAFPAIRKSNQISLDKRRKSCHQWNVDKLQDFKLNQNPM